MSTITPQVDAASQAADRLPQSGGGPPWVDDPAGAYSIKRHGVTITNCDDEPVSTPGCAQSRGVVMSVKADDLTVSQVSENAAALLGVPAEELGGEPVRRAVGESGEARLRTLLETELLERSPLYAFTLPGAGAATRLDVSVHTLGGLGPAGRAILEFEPTGRTSDSDGDGSRTPTPSIADDVYPLLRGAVGRLQAAGGLDDLCRRVTQEVRALTGLDRVMVYKFHEDWHGEVVAEAHGGNTHSWLGMHFPASDIPAPAREAFKKMWIRPLPDAAAPPAELVPLTDPHTLTPLEMTHCALRGASVMYTEYLANIGVAASLTMPILRDGELWGLIACHHETPTEFPFQLRAACELLAQVVSLQLRSAVDQDNLAYRLRLEEVHGQMVAAASREGELATLVEGTPSLLEAIDATGGALFHHDRWWRIGETPTPRQLDDLSTWLETQPEFRSATRPVFAADDLPARFPDAASYSGVAAGILAVPLAGVRGSAMIWFRPETERTVDWAGNPADKPSMPGPHGDRLTPRSSFELFRQSVRGKSRPWKEVEIEAAVRLRLLVMELVIGRSEVLAELNVDLSRSNEELDAFAYVASHDLKEPLRGISKYAHQLAAEAAARDPEADSDPRLERLVRLTARMDGLLDSLLHFSRVGRAELDRRPEDLNEILEEALEMSAVRLEEANAEVIVSGPLPTVRCDRVRVREIFLNLVTNAIKYNDSSPRRIEIGFSRPGQERPGGPGPKGTEKHTAFFVRDNGIGIAAKHRPQVFQMFKRLHGRDAYGGGTGAGLTIVKKLVERHNGLVWLASELGEGTTVLFTLPDAEFDR